MDGIKIAKLSIENEAIYKSVYQEIDALIEMNGKIRENYKS